MKFTPVTKMANSIPRALIEFSRERGIDVKLLDYELLSFETLIKRPKADEYQIVTDMATITPEDIKNSSTTIIQEYDIKIMPLAKKESQIKLSLAVNKLKTKAVITIKEGSVFINKTNLLKILKQKIWDKKLRAGLLIDIFESNLDKQLKKLLTIVPRDKKIAKEIKFTVASGLAQIAPVDGKIEKLYEQKAQESDSLISGIDVGELILRYTKPKNGENGRSCTGKYLLTREPIVIDKKPAINETIKEKVSTEFIEYFANDTGYVLYKSGEYIISKTLQLKEANFKSTANIDAGDDDKDISVHIGQAKTHNDDSIGSGVNIDVKELSVDGSVASNVQITTQELNIEAQTHRNSKMEVKNTASIKLHRGDLVATEANIDVLESGKVTAHKSIHVKQMIGGIAIAPIVIIDELISNSVVIASERIEIKTIIGWDNSLTIDPNEIQSYHNEVEAMKDKIKTQEKSLTVKKSSLSSRVKEHSAKVTRIKTFQERIIAAKKSGKSPVKQDVLRIRQYKMESEKLTKEKEFIEEKELLLEEKKQELEKLYNQDLHAKVLYRGQYDGATKIVFIDPKTREKYTKSPEGTYEEISLTLDSSENKAIKLS